MLEKKDWDLIKSKVKQLDLLLRIRVLKEVIAQAASKRIIKEASELLQKAKEEAKSYIPTVGGDFRLPEPPKDVNLEELFVQQEQERPIQSLEEAIEEELPEDLNKAPPEEDKPFKYDANLQREGSNDNMLKYTISGKEDTDEIKYIANPGDDNVTTKYMGNQNPREDREGDPREDLITSEALDQYINPASRRRKR